MILDAKNHQNLKKIRRSMFNYLFLSAANWPSCSTVDRGYFKPGPTHLVFNINKNIFYFFQMTPSHIEVNRCAGGCNHRQQSCLPTRVRKKKIPVSTQNSLNSLFICSRYFVRYYGRSVLPIMEVPISVIPISHSKIGQANNSRPKLRQAQDFVAKKS